MSIISRTAGLAVAASFVACATSSAKPLDKNAGRIWTLLRGKLANHKRPGRLEAEELELVLATSDMDNGDCQTAAAYALAFAGDSEVALQKLEALRGRGDGSSLVAQAARFSLLLRQTLPLSPQERLARLSLQLGRERGGFARLFLVNWLGCEYGDSMGPTFRAALPEEKDKYVRMEYAYFLVHFGGTESLKAVRKMLERKEDWFIPEQLRFILHAITPRPAELMYDNTYVLRVELDKLMSESPRAEDNGTIRGTGAVNRDQATEDGD